MERNGAGDGLRKAIQDHLDQTWPDQGWAQVSREAARAARAWLLGVFEQEIARVTDERRRRMSGGE